MKALILAGGLGTRLRPLTYTRPKHLLPIGTKPHLEHVFDLLRRHDVNDVVMLTSYMADAFAEVEKRAEDSGMSIEVTHEPEPLGTAGAIKNAEVFLEGEGFFAFNGDVLTDVDLGWMLERHKEVGAEASILLTPVEDPSAFGVVPTDSADRVEGFIEKPPREEAPTNYINAGVYIFEPSILERIPAGEVWSAERQLFPQLVAEGAQLFAFGTDAYWMDIGTPEKYLRANLDLLEGAFSSDGLAALESGCLVAREAQVAETARVSSSVVGGGAVIEREASVSESVLLPGARVEEGARVSGSILGEGAVVADSSTAVGITLGDGERYEG